MTSRAAPLAVGVPKPLTKQVERDRVLSDDEISSLWKACEEIGWPFGPVFQLLLLTAQRKKRSRGDALVGTRSRQPGVAPTQRAHEKRKGA